MDKWRNYWASCHKNQVNSSSIDHFSDPYTPKTSKKLSSIFLFVNFWRNSLGLIQSSRSHQYFDHQVALIKNQRRHHFPDCGKWFSLHQENEILQLTIFEESYFLSRVHIVNVRGLLERGVKGKENLLEVARAPWNDLNFYKNLNQNELFWKSSIFLQSPIGSV